MPPAHKWLEHEQHAETDEMAADRQTSSLAGLALTLALVVVSLVLVHHLRHEAQIEDCLLAGRSDCTYLIGPQS